jgi:hypothetical protein
MPNRLTVQEHPGDHHCEPLPISYLTKTAAEAGLIWENWDDIFLVYQPSSAETHVFNETTGSILTCLEDGRCIGKRTEGADRSCPRRQPG